MTLEHVSRSKQETICFPVKTVSREILALTIDEDLRFLSSLVANGLMLLFHAAVDARLTDTLLTGSISGSCA